MKYWTKEGSRYTLIKNASTVYILIILGICFLGLAFFLTLPKVAFYGCLFFGILSVLGGFTKHKEQVYIDTKTKKLTVVRTIFSRKFDYDFHRFSRFEVHKVTYALLPVATSVHGYFIDANGREKMAQMRVVTWSFSDKWTQEMIDETEKIIAEMNLN